MVELAETRYSPARLAAELLGCREGELLKVRWDPGEVLVVIGPTGQKYRFGQAELEDAARKIAPSSPALPPSRGKGVKGGKEARGVVTTGGQPGPDSVTNLTPSPKGKGKSPYRAPRSKGNRSR